jgi:hypothetical protein
MGIEYIGARGMLNPTASWLDDFSPLHLPISALGIVDQPAALFAPRSDR